MTHTTARRPRRAAALLTFVAVAAMTAHASAEDPLLWRAAAGGELNVDSHGVLDLGVRQGALSLELMTDTLILQFAPLLERGRWWVTGRLEGGAAGLLISPWRDGAPAPEEAMLASYLGVESGGMFYLPGGLYLGGILDARVYHFAALPTTEVEVPGLRPLVSPDVLFGWWTRRAQADLRAGVDLTPSGQAPRVRAHFAVTPPGPVVPTLEGWAGLGHNQGLLTLTRLGGLNPYVVPLAGAAWAEFRAQDYAVLRLGPRLSGDLGQLALVGDMALFDGQRAVGAALIGRYTGRGFFVETSLGVAPGLQRRDGLLPVSAWIRVGSDWRAW